MQGLTCQLLLGFRCSDGIYGRTRLRRKKDRTNYYDETAHGCVCIHACVCMGGMKQINQNYFKTDGVGPNETLN